MKFNKTLMLFAFIMSMRMGAFGLGFLLGDDTCTVWMALLAAVLQFAKMAALACLMCVAYDPVAMILVDGAMAMEHSRKGRAT
jgi:hypothetical protein